jgi:hypothetical protein
MVIEDAGPNPKKLAEAIHAQLKLRSGAVPIHAIARALDIVDIREERLPGMEGALVMPLDRNQGAIFANARSSGRRRRFTIAHELGHFLNPWHEPPSPLAFACTAEDLRTTWRDLPRDPNRHWQQDSQANRFAIELLAWLAHSPKGELLTQRLFQAKGYSITLLMLDEPGEEDAMPRF